MGHTMCLYPYAYVQSPTNASYWQLQVEMIALPCPYLSTGLT